MYCVGFCFSVEDGACSNPAGVEFFAGSASYFFLIHTTDDQLVYPFHGRDDVFGVSVDALLASAIARTTRSASAVATTSLVSAVATELSSG